jgi:hypothetical protein
VLQIRPTLGLRNSWIGFWWIQFTGAKWRHGFFYSDPSIMDTEVADRAKAGLPEK